MLKPTLIIFYTIFCSATAYSKTTKEIKLDFLSSEEVHAKCNELLKTNSDTINLENKNINACTHKDKNTFNIKIKEPIHFDDYAGLVDLGSEILKIFENEYTKNIKITTQSSSEYINNNQPITYKTTSKSAWSIKKININWLSNNRIEKTCKSFARRIGVILPFNISACARTNPTDPEICEIYTESPENNKDYAKLKILGHEVWHCFGAKHEE